ncbi:MAG: hypothetical protein AB7G93_16850 [Bdellovibrionales bacterium]
MRTLILFLTVAFSGVAQAGQKHTVVLDKYVYRGSLTEMVDSLQERLAQKITQVCGAQSPIVTSHLSINFVRGELAGNGPLETEVMEYEGRLGVDFPGHPKAVMTASFECL